MQLSTFAFMLKNLVRQRGLQRLAGRVHLTGTGMAMPFELFRASAAVRSSIVEDLALGLELAGQGRAPQLIEDAFVWSGGSSEQGTLIQRRRWEGGFLATAAQYGPKTILKGSVLAGLDLLIPPLALFAALNLVALGIAAILTLAFGAAKRLLRSALHSQLDWQLRQEGAEITQLGDTADGLEGVAAFAAKRAPQFRGR